MILKVWKIILTVFLPLIILFIGAYILSIGSYGNPSFPTFKDPNYFLKILLSFLAAGNLYYIYFSNYQKKEIAALIIPLLYLLFFCFPYGILFDYSPVLFLVFHQFFPGYYITGLLFAGYFMKIISIGMKLKKEE